MYEELIKSLRTDHDKYFARDMEAADVIEELSAKYQKVLSDLVKQAEPSKEE